MAASPHPHPDLAPLQLYSVVIPARDEEQSLPPTISAISSEFRQRGIPHEIVVVDDGSRDATSEVVRALQRQIAELRLIRNEGEHGFGRAVVKGLDHATGDAVVIMMADASDDPADAARYWELLQSGFECAFGSRFVRGSRIYDYPRIKLLVNRCANLFLQAIFSIRLNDTTNAFKAYRRTVIDGCRPFLAPHFNLTVEIPLKAIVRGYSWTVIPIGWRNRKYGAAKLKIKEMGSRYFFICMYVWLEKYFSRGDYRRA